MGVGQVWCLAPDLTSGGDHESVAMVAREVMQAEVSAIAGRGPGHREWPQFLGALRRILRFLADPGFDEL